MGTIIKAKRDGFRRAGLVHHMAGTYYQDGDLTEAQLEVLRADPQLLVVEGAQEDALAVDDDSAEVIQELAGTIAQLEYSLEQARAGLRTASADVIRLLEQQKGAPALVLDAVRLLEPSDPAAEGVICIKEDALVEIIRQQLQVTSGVPNDGIQTLDNSSSPETPPNPTPLPADAPAT
ncbi:HI1506-related protein, partial [Pseudomonas qingdaonensis]